MRFVNGIAEGCGGTLNLTVAHPLSFRSQLDSRYDALQDCHWLVETEQGYSIQFNINDFDVKKSIINSTELGNKTECSGDYLEVKYLNSFCKDYFSSQNPSIFIEKIFLETFYMTESVFQIRDGGPFAELLGHFCGYTAPPSILSTSNLLWIRFVTDATLQGSGVRGNLKAVTSKKPRYFFQKTCITFRILHQF